MQHGHQCGMIWGAALAAGTRAYRLFGPSCHAEAKAVIAGQRLVESFRALNKNINCAEISEIDKAPSVLKIIMSSLAGGGAVKCFRMAARYAPVAFNEIDSVLSRESVETPSEPVSCAALLASRIGVSDIHRTMVSGFAGGIGLSGGACGALGAAIWILGMQERGEESGKKKLEDPRLERTIERFLKYTDYEFECSKIVGRTFENVNDHTDYLRSGGCQNIIEVLATSQQA